ncbi:unnamed protein product [Brassica napus]|uniref:(rape) hypothetical protein n=1 Tax=Brassica napus TaxID=3708 RepID=A0A816JQP3_BRANA|nr:unnamed protein product [Brassica napus]
MAIIIRCSYLRQNRNSKRSMCAVSMHAFKTHYQHEALAIPQVSFFLKACEFRQILLSSVSRTKTNRRRKPNWREQALSRADTSIRSGSVDVIVADRALEYKMGDAHMIIQAATCLELQSMVVLKRKGSPRRGDSADEESKRNSASDGPAKAKRPRCEK